MELFFLVTTNSKYRNSIHFQVFLVTLNGRLQEKKKHAKEQNPIKHLFVKVQESNNVGTEVHFRMKVIKI
jgi:hypothetical protein